MALLEFFQLVDAAQEGTLAGTRGPNDADYFARHHGQVGALDNFMNAVVALVQVRNLYFVLFFHEVYNLPFYIAVVLIFIGVIILSIDEIKETKEKREEFKKNNGIKKLFTLAIVFPLFYALFDGVGTFLDGVFLDKLELINADSALISYEFTFLVYGLITWIYLKKKEPKIKVFDEWNLIAAAICEMVGQVFYVFAMAENATIAAPIIGSYCVMTMLLSRVFLKEKLSKIEYVGIFLVLAGVIILSIMDV